MEEQRSLGGISERAPGGGSVSMAGVAPAAPSLVAPLPPASCYVPILLACVTMQLQLLPVAVSVDAALKTDGRHALSLTFGPCAGILGAYTGLQHEPAKRHYLHLQM